MRRLTRHLAVQEGGRVLDYGCADMPYHHLFDDSVEVLGADLPGNPAAAIDVFPDGTLPTDGESFDAVLSTQVLEHVVDPGQYLSECFRILRPGGRLLLTTHGIMIYHPDPVDLWRWTSAGLRRAVEEAGFEVVRFEGIMGLVPTGLQLLQDGVYHRLRRRLLKQALALVMQALIGVIARRERPGSLRHNALVFAVVASKPRPAAVSP